MDQNNSTRPNFAQMKTEARKKFLSGAIAAAVLGTVYFFVVNNAEQQTGEVKVHVLIAMVYNSMGKMGGTALFAGITALLLVVYAVKMMNIKKQEQQS
jgi:hypothetical protein